MKGDHKECYANGIQNPAE
uniref:Uncharacterized protein n=1 Tax=Arundo donax TaxID=35708 RepID=A0A0A9A8J0_ARUDO